MKKVKVSVEHQKAIDRLIAETDWNKFWQKVTEKSAAEIDAYQIARAKSLRINHFFV